MTKETQINFIREKCIEANPEILESHQSEEDGEIVWLHLPRPIRLADVLLAIKTKYPLHQLQVSEIAFGKTDEGMWIEIAWNLRADDLREQSEKTVSFLADLLQ